jgi:FdhD protein
MSEQSIDRSAVCAVRPLRISTEPNGHAPEVDPGNVIGEAPLTIDIRDVGAYTIMCTPADTLALAVGFLFTESIIDGVRDIGVLGHCEDDPGVVRVQLADPSRATGQADRNLLMVSSCGLCGSETVAERLERIPQCEDRLSVPATSLRLAAQAMRERQRLFKETGGTHAAAIFGREGAIVAFAEDIGRHSALDKAIGACLLSGSSPVGHGVALSGRVSFEMIAKCARAGLEVVAAVSAPTSLALEAAQHSNITLCAFVRADRATVYCGSHRIVTGP